MHLVEGLGKEAGLALFAVPMMEAFIFTQAPFRRIIIKHLGPLAHERFQRAAHALLSRWFQFSHCDPKLHWPGPREQSWAVSWRCRGEREKRSYRVIQNVKRNWKKHKITSCCFVGLWSDGPFDGGLAEFQSRIITRDAP